MTDKPISKAEFCEWLKVCIKRLDNGVDLSEAHFGQELKHNTEELTYKLVLEKAQSIADTKVLEDKLAETWANINGFIGRYQVSNIGRVKSFSRATPIIMKQHPNMKGYPIVFLSLRKGKNMGRSVHRLMAMAFCSGFKDGLQVNHKDGNKNNNHFLNLEWVTLKENSEHCRATGLYNNTGENHSLAKLTREQVNEIRRIRKETGIRFKDIAIKFGISTDYASQICRGETWKHLLKPTGGLKQ